jgi:hypothetical protein
LYFVDCSESSCADYALVLKGGITAGCGRGHALRRRCCEDMASSRRWSVVGGPRGWLQVVGVATDRYGF